MHIKNLDSLGPQKTVLILSAVFSHTLEHVYKRFRVHNIRGLASAPQSIFTVFGLEENLETQLSSEVADFIGIALDLKLCTTSRCTIILILVVMDKLSLSNRFDYGMSVVSPVENDILMIAFNNFRRRWSPLKNSKEPM